MSVDVRLAEQADLGALAILFDAYRVFYKQESDLPAADSFLRDRFRLRDSTIFMATQGDSVPLGFVQLYPSFSSVSMRRIFILNDLFVAPVARRMGVADALIHESHAFASKQGAARLSLSTAIDNVSAQALYEGTGFKRDESFYQYHREL